MKRLLAIFVVFLLSACAATGPAYQAAPAPAAGQALVYIYRLNTVYGGGRDTYFYVDGKNIADLSVEGYTAFYVPAGEHKFEQKWPADMPQGKTINLWKLWTKEDPADSAKKPGLQEGAVNWEAGKTYYYRFSAAPNGRNQYEWILAEITAEQAYPDLKKSKLQKPFNNK
ncbi:DUF2846 domain-containing protein [Undibacterium sp. Ji50W]|uniref:DUF2846 domain-containing protein n=1 Tax=Undibacterium TaxID=401469 RepID=UPI003BF35A82